MASTQTFRRLLSAAALLLSSAGAALAHRPVLESSLRPGGTWEQAAQVADPTHASTATYGRLDEPGEVDFYKFTAARAETVPVEALVPVRPSHADFRPAVAVLGRNLPETPGLTLPFPAPEGFRAAVVHTPEGGRAYFYEPYSQERLYRGGEARVALVPGETYYVAVYEPRRRTGAYSLGMGTVEHFEDVSKVGVVWNVLAVKLGLAGARRVPWLDVLATFVALAGLALGFGSAAFSLFVELTGGGDARASAPQKVAANLAFPALLVALLGLALLYRETWLSGVAPFQGALALLLVLLHLYLAFRLTRRARRAAVADVPGVPPPPAARKRLVISHALSLACWSGCLLLLVWHALVLR